MFTFAAIFILPSTDAAEPKKSYTKAEMPKVMAATWNQNVAANDTEKAVLHSLLKRGQLIVINEQTKKTKWMVSAGILVNASPETLFKVITDIENYSEFMPMTEGAKTNTYGPNIVELNLTLKIKVIKSLPAIPINYSVLHYHRPPYRSDWTYYSGRFERNDGFYQFVPVNGGKQTLAFYNVYSLPRIPIATNMFKKDPALELVLNISTAVMVTRCLKSRAEEVEKRKPFMPGKGMKGNAIDAIAKNPKAVKLLLDRGGMVLIEEGQPMWATTAVAMNAPPKRVFNYVTKFEDYKCYQSQVVESKVLNRSASSAKAYFKVNLDYAVLKIPLKYELDFAFKSPQSIVWNWAKGDVASQRGSWTFLPLDAEKRTLALYRQTEDLKSLPGILGKGLRSGIYGQPSLEPAILGSQALLVARSTRDFFHLSAREKKELLDKCKAGK